MTSVCQCGQMSSIMETGGTPGAPTRIRISNESEVIRLPRCTLGRRGGLRGEGRRVDGGVRLV